jgi:thioredoxin-like negative regulator of GroEL
VIWVFVLAIERAIQKVQQASLLVVCLCAEWCGVCRDYQECFEVVATLIQTDHPGTLFVWLDVEDEADFLHPLDVENFPTLLIGVGDVPLFCGPVTPHVSTLERMVRTLAQEADHAPLDAPQLAALIKKIRHEKL